MSPEFLAMIESYRPAKDAGRTPAEVAQAAFRDGRRYIEVIAVVRWLFDMGLPEAKAIVDEARNKA